MIPGAIRAGDTVAWTVAATTHAQHGAIAPPDWSLTTYLRTAAADGVTVAGAADGTSGWTFTFNAAADMTAGQWYWQELATGPGGETVTTGAGAVTVLPSLAYSGSPASIDGRSATRIELDQVQAAIRAIITRGAKAYTIGNRQLTALDMGTLYRRESILKARLAREEAAQRVAAGLGHPGRAMVRIR